MGVRAVAVVAGLALSVWGYTQVTAPEPVPSSDLLVQLAEEYWGEGYCGSGEYQWPCLIITDIKLDASNTDKEPRDKGDNYRACYDISVQTETTPWDSAQNIPSEPRTYVQTEEPFHQCADVYFFSRDETDASDWSFTPVGEAWWKRPTAQLLDYLCSQTNGQCPIV